MDGLFLTTCRHWWERVNNTVIEFHLSETDRTGREPGRTAWQTETLPTVLFPRPRFGQELILLVDIMFGILKDKRP